MEGNLRKIGGIVKGRVGETLFHSFYKEAIPAKEIIYNLSILRFHKIPYEIQEFLLANGKSFDALEIVNLDNELPRILLYEVKAMNYYNGKGVHHGNKPCITRKSASFYRKAQEIGLQIKSASIVFYNSWEFKIREAPFNIANFAIWDGKKV